MPRNKRNHLTIKAYALKTTLQNRRQKNPDQKIIEDDKRGKKNTGSKINPTQIFYKK